MVDPRPQFREPQPDRLQHAIEISINFLIGKAQNRIALSCEYRKPRDVACDLCARRVRCPVDFNDEPRLEAREVGDVAAEDDLTAESKARDLLAPQTLPQAPLGARRIAPEDARGAL